MKIGDEVFVHGYVDEIRRDCIIIRNDGGYFGTIEDEIISVEIEAFYKDETEPYCHLIMDERYKAHCIDCAEKGSYKCTKCDGEMYYKDTPQPEEKHAICNGCVYCDLPNAFHPCASCVDFSKYVGEKSGDTPQNDCHKK